MSTFSTLKRVEVGLTRVKRIDTEPTRRFAVGVNPVISLDCRFLNPSGAGGVVHSARALVDGLSRVQSPFRFRVHSLLPSPVRGAAPVTWVQEPRWKFRAAQRWGGGHQSLESQAELVHYPFQRYQDSLKPVVFEPHDLLWMIRPELFSWRERRQRTRLIRRGLKGARAVVVPSRFVADSVAEFFPQFRERVFVVGGLCPVQGVRPEALRTPENYVLYPAEPWAHKNHRRLFRALKVLETKGVPVTLILTGFGDFSRLFREVKELDLGDQVLLFRGVSSGQLVTLYRQSRGVILPSLFEGFGLPAREAAFLGTPVVTADSTALRDFGASSFDPHSIDSIAEALKKLWEGQVPQLLKPKDPNLEAANKYLHVYRHCLDQ